MFEYLYKYKEELMSIVYGLLFAVLGAIGLYMSPPVAAVIISLVMLYTYNEKIFKDGNIEFFVIGIFIGLIIMPVMVTNLTPMFSFECLLPRIFISTLLTNLYFSNYLDTSGKYYVAILFSAGIAPISVATLFMGVYLNIISFPLFFISLIVYVCSFLFNYYIIKEPSH